MIGLVIVWNLEFIDFLSIAKKKKKKSPGNAPTQKRQFYQYIKSTKGISLFPEKRQIIECFNDQFLGSFDNNWNEKKSKTIWLYC